MINIFSPLNTLGYGIHSCNMIKALTESKEEINLTPLGQPQIDRYYQASVQQAVNNRNKFDINSPSLFIFHDEFSNQASGGPLMTFSIFETDKLKDLSVHMLKNGPTDIILTTTKQHKEILESYNIGKPIHIVHEGIDDSIFNTIPVDKYIDTGKFTYIIVGKKEERKNTSMSLDTFIKTMKDKDVALIAHTFNPFANKKDVHPFKNLESWSDVNPIDQGFEYKGWKNNYHLFSYKNCDIYFTASGINTTQMSSLYHSANIGIQISRGEGWGLPECEMMACGVPIIVTDVLGHSEYIHGAPDIQKDLIITPEGKVEANDGIWFNGNQGNWYNIQGEKYESSLIHTFDNQELYIEKSEDLATYMENEFSWNKAVEQLKNIIN